MIVVDTCVWIDIFDADPRWADWSADRVAEWKGYGPQGINDTIYAELASNFSTVEALDHSLALAGVEWKPMSRAALYLAGQARTLYKRRGGRAGLLADFLVGAHALTLGCPVLTRDPQRFQSYYPKLRLVQPGAAAR